ncbi:MFS transporter [Pantoea sp. Ap-967]|uniref:MFS transporter n=1 Tax=Pantoea sp. Ap-967 TaxID=2608362 RepID=UPI0014237C46|nr:MFS transporter [Pantoea sp. Ap-967]NIE78033.1 MFS transporter [Pantoea sp. Ap-967]
MIAGSTIHRKRWMIGGLLGLGSFVNYVDRVNLSIAATPLAQSLDLSPAEMGIVFSAFLWTYAILQIPMGMLIDKIGVSWAMRIATLLWGVATLLTIFAGGLGLLIVARLILGVAEAPVVPAAWKATGYWFPKNERGMCTAMFDGASKLSMVIGIPMMAYAVSHYGWHAAFYVSLVMSMFYCIVFWMFYRSPQEMKDKGWLTEQEHRYILEGGAQSEEKAETGSGLKGVKYLLSQRKTWGLAIGFASYTYCFYVLLTWMPAYLEKQLGLNVLSSGMYSSLPWAFAIAAEFIIGGWLVDKLISRGKDSTKVRQYVLIGSMLLSLCVVGAAFADTVWLALVFLSLGAAGLAITAPTASSIVALIAPQGQVAALGGIVNCVANFCGIAAPIVTGLIYQATGSFSIAFLACGGVAVIGILSYVCVLGRITAIPDQPEADLVGQVAVGPQLN